MIKRKEKLRGKKRGARVLKMVPRPPALRVRQ